VNYNAGIIAQHLVSFDLDLVAVTESWLTPDSGDEVLRGVCPEGYLSLHRPRLDRRGGGLALIYRSTIRPHIIDIPFIPTAFESLACSFSINSSTILLVLIYRPPNSSHVSFLVEFGQFLDHLINVRGNLLIVGDFNIHVDDRDSTFAEDFSSVLVSHDLVQHVKEATHIDNHTLDLVISRSNLVSRCYASDLISDHFAVHWSIKAHRPLRPRKWVSFRNLKAIDTLSFEEDLLALPVITEAADNLEDLLTQYNEGLSSVLHKHAPLIKRRTTIRPENPWASSEIFEIRRRVRKQERRWRRTRLEIDKQLLQKYLCDLKRSISNAKTNFLESKITECGEHSSLVKIVDSFLDKKSGLPLPKHKSLPLLLEDFGKFFGTKIKDLLCTLPTTTNLTTKVAAHVSSMNVFHQVSVNDVYTLMCSSKSKSTSLDPMPTFLVKRFARILAVPIASIINMSIANSSVPAVLKLAHVTPLLKKSCPPDSLSSYRPISSLPFVAKLLERVVGKQLISHVEGNELYSSVQLAHRSHHSTETALLKIVNDVLLAADRGDAALLALFDLSAAFDTVDHTLLISRLSSRFGLCGDVLKWFMSYLSDRQQCVRVSGISSSPLLLETSVPQGSILGPLLFILYTAPLHDISTRFPTIRDHYYADDTQLLTTFRPSADAVDQNRALNELALCASELN
jgi:hypothetical protein